MDVIFRLLRKYSAAFVLSGNGFTGISFTTLDAALSDLFIGVELFWYLLYFVSLSKHNKFFPTVFGCLQANFN